jgi:hypothetical protein
MLRQTFVAIEISLSLSFGRGYPPAAAAEYRCTPIVIAPKETLGEPHPDGNVILLAECLS